MSKRVFTDESLETLVNEVKTYADNAAVNNPLRINIGGEYDTGHQFVSYDGSSTTEISVANYYHKHNPLNIMVVGGENSNVGTIIKYDGSLEADIDVAGAIHGHDVATQDSDGFMSADDKVKLDKSLEDISQLSSEKADKTDIHYVTPQMYGAKCDGVTDDTQAFRAAINASNNVYVPSGNYLITDTLDISYKKSLYSDDGQRATILYNGNNSVVNIGRMSVFRNIDITIKNAFSGIIFDTNNYDKNSGEPALGSRVEHVVVDFETYSPNATLIGLTADSSTDANNIPKLKGFCFQTYHDIHVDNSSEAYGYGIKMEIIQGRGFSTDSTGYPWITHISYSDISLAHPHTAIKALVTLPDGASFNRYNGCSMGEIRFDNVYSQCFQESDKHELTRYFIDIEHFGGFFTKCIAWDYHYFIASGGVTDTDHIINIIGENVTACFSDCSMSSWDSDLLNTCRFEAETEFNVTDNPEYFMRKYFSGTILTEGYDSIDAKIDAKLSGEYVAKISEEKIAEILYSGYSNILDDPLTQIKFRQRWSGSSNAWVEQIDMVHITTVIIPIVQGGNIIRWSAPNVGNPNNAYSALYFFNDDELTESVDRAGGYESLWNEEGGYLQVDNPNGYKYVSIPFCSSYFDDSELETMVMTINREITNGDGMSYTEYIRENVVNPVVSAKVTEEIENLSIPTKTSELENDSKFITAEDIPEAQVPDLSGYALKSSAETWTFTLADGSTVTKKVVLA